MKVVYVMIADGFEEIEALSVVDILRRASIDVSTVSISDSKIVNGTRCGSTKIKPEEFK